MMRQRPDIVREHMRVRARAWGGLGLRGHLPGPLRNWVWRNGAGVLVCWAGERLPLPTLDPAGTRPAWVVGLAPGLEGQVDTFADVSFADGVYHFAVLAAAPAGAVAEIEPLEVQTRVYDGGALVGLMPNAPSLVQVRRLGGNRPRVSWTYSRVGEQAAPSSFEVYACDETTEFDFDAAAAGSTVFASGRRRYHWVGDPLEEGDVRYYTVRAMTAGGVQSLIPRNGIGAGS